MDTSNLLPQTLSPTAYQIGLPLEMTLSDGSMVRTVYAANGRKLREMTILSGTSATRSYSGSCIFEGNTLKKVLFEGGYAQMSGSTPSYMFFLTDHLGSVRVVAAQNADVKQANQYYPFGDLIADSRVTAGTSDNRYRFTGKEFGERTGLYDFSARYLETSTGRFTTIDPLAEKYPSVSPYAYCAGDPVNMVDWDGRDSKRRIDAARELIGKPYSNDSGELRTGVSKEALSGMDCSEFVNRVLFADKITDTVLSLNTAEMVSFFSNKTQFVKDSKPKSGDIALWSGHVGIVSEVGKNDAVKIIHARGEGKLSAENPICIPVTKYRENAEFLGYFRPRIEDKVIYSAEAEIDPLIITGEAKSLPILNAYAKEEK